MLFIRKIKAGCLLLGILYFGGSMVQMSDRLYTKSETSVQTAAEEASGCQEADSIGNSIERMEEQYRRLLEEEARTSSALEEFMEIHAGDDDRSEAEELARKLRHLHVQEQVLKARLEEMGQDLLDESLKNP